MAAYRFGSFVLDVTERRLIREGTAVPLAPKAFDTLTYLAERQGRLITKDELLDAIWGGSHVEEGSLPRTIHVLRKALMAPDGVGAPGPRYIETVPTKGYRFVADVTRLEPIPHIPDVPVPDSPPEPRRALSKTLWMLAGITVFGLAGAAATWTARFARSDREATALHQQYARTTNGPAYVRFQAGRLHLDRHLAGDIEAAVEAFEAAIQLDPGFADAYAGKADAKFFRYWETGSHDDIAQARLAIRNALHADSDSSYAHALQCRLLGTYDWDFTGAHAECVRAATLDPGNHEARREFAFLLSSMGKWAEALEEIDAAIALAPTSFNKRSRGVLLYFAGRFDAATAQLSQLERTDPEYVESSQWLARCYEQSGAFDQALNALVRFREATGATPAEIVALRQAFATEGWPAVLRSSLLHSGPAPSLDAAGSFAQLGQDDAALDVLASMIDARRVMVVQMGSDPRLRPLHGDPRFERLLRRVGLRQTR